MATSEFNLEKQSGEVEKFEEPVILEASLENLPGADAALLSSLVTNCW